jgi:dTDP-glucose 4,6-dehydratase
MTTSLTDHLPAQPHLLVTGGAGFIGSCFVRDILARRDGTTVTVLDKLTYAGNEANLAVIHVDPEQAARFRFVRGDIADATVVDPLVADSDAVVNFAAESHVDRSILDPEAFLRTGVLGVHVLLEAVRREATRAAVEPSARGGLARVGPRFLQVSTDEVYGSVDAGRSVEKDPLAPRSPYAAAKAAGELLVRAYHVTYGLDVVLTRGSNTYGPHQHPEKLIPLFVTNALEDRPLPMYGDGLQERDWLYVSDHAAAIEHVLRYGSAGEAYNAPGGTELPNREVIARLLGHLGKPWSLVRQVPDRPGHDRRYAMDGSKLAALGWAPAVPFDEGLARTLDWYRDHTDWWQAARSGDWDAYYERQYGERLEASVAAPASTVVASSSAVPSSPTATTARATTREDGGGRDAGPAGG